MAEVKCEFKASFKTGNMPFYEYGMFETWLPESEAVRLQNDREGRERLFRLHFPSAESISGEVWMGLFYK